MDWWEMFTRIFCQGVIKEKDRLKEEVDRLNRQVQVLQVSLDSCEGSRKIYSDKLDAAVGEIAGLNSQLQTLKAQLDGCEESKNLCSGKLNEALSEKVNLNSQLETCREQLEEKTGQLNLSLQHINELTIENEKLKEDAAYYEDRIRKLTSTLATSIIIPDVTSHIAERKIVKPSEMISGYRLDFADWEYYAFPLEAWKQILNLAFEEKKKVIKDWKIDISDCDNHALIMNAVVNACFIKTGLLDKQGAFSIVWSMTHAYCLFIDIDGNKWILEPQNNITVGKLGETKPPYDSKEIFFIGKKV